MGVVPELTSISAGGVPTITRDTPFVAMLPTLFLARASTECVPALRGATTKLYDSWELLKAPSLGIAVDHGPASTRYSTPVTALIVQAVWVGEGKAISIAVPV